METEEITTPQTRRDIGVLLAIAAVASALGIALGLLIDWFPVAASEEAKDIDTLYDVLIIASVPVFVLVVSFVLYCVYRFKMRPGDELRDGPPIHGNTRLEVIWTMIPSILMFGLCAYAYVVLEDIEDTAQGATPMEIYAVGEQFTWTFRYPAEGGSGKDVVTNRLYVPIGKQIKFVVQSKDVLHDFWVPAWRQKIDAVPGIDTSFKITPNKRGVFEIVCAELCGLGHAAMRQNAYVVEPAKFDEWLAKQRAGTAEGGGATGGSGTTAGGSGGGIDGKGLFTTAEPSCGACHTFAAAGTQSTVGPDLDATLKGKDEAYVRESILDPDAKLAAGFEDKGGIMPPNYGETLDPAEVDALVKFLVESTR